MKTKFKIGGNEPPCGTNWSDELAMPMLIVMLIVFLVPVVLWGGYFLGFWE